jgi:hypothetical protein
MLYILLWNAVSHPALLPLWSVRMRQKAKKNPKQAELLFEPNPSSSPVPIRLRDQQKLELEQAVADLLLRVARTYRSQTRGDDDT